MSRSVGAFQQHALAYFDEALEALSGMVNRRDIQRVCNRIVREFQPLRVILFGSYAYGRPTPDSDVDLLVVMPFQGRSTEQAVKISSRLDHRFPIDVLVRSPEEVKQRLAWNDFFIREITEKGKVLYESGDAGVGGQG